MSHKTLGCSEVIDRDCMKQVRSRDTAGPGGDKADVEAAVARAGCSHVQDMIDQLYWKAIEWWWTLGYSGFGCAAPHCRPGRILGTA